MKLGTLKSGQMAIVAEGRAVPIPSSLAAGSAAADVILNFERLRPELTRLTMASSNLGADPGAFDAPIRRPGAIWAAASNYRRGTTNMEEGRGRGETRGLSARAVLEMAFLKPASSITGPGTEVVIPRFATTIFPELELCVVIGRRCKNVGRADALAYVFGYTIMLDVTARGYGENEDLRATRCVRKGFDTFAPLGPWITTAEEIPDPQDLEMRLWVNNELTQSASTSAMINDVAELVAFLSSVATLEPGDLIATGNPDSPRHQRQLQGGDVVRASIEGIGEMTLTVGVE